MMKWARIRRRLNEDFGVIVDIVISLLYSVEHASKEQGLLENYIPLKHRRIYCLRIMTYRLVTQCGSHHE